VLAGAAISLGALDAFPRLWGFQVWHYLPFPAALCAATLGTALCLRPVRERGIVELSRVLPSLPRWTPASATLGFVAVAALLYGFRERQIYLGDARILLYSTIDRAFFFPDVGATWLFHLLAHAARTTELTNFGATQIGISLAGAGAIVCLAGLARTLSPSRGRALGFVAIVLAGGLVRVLAGHVEVYAFVLLAASGFLWSGARCLRGGVALWVPSLVYGIGLWIHPSFVFLFPGLAVLVASRSAGRASPIRTWVSSGAIAAAPFTLFLAIALVTGGSAQLLEAWDASVSIATSRSEHGGHWLVLPFSTPGPSTQWAVLSLPHLRFLANTAYLLAPCALPLLIGMKLSGPTPEPALHTTRFLATAALGTGLYALVLRPFWGPYDWDLFSLSALCVSCFAAYLWSRSDAPWTASIGLLAAAAGWLYVALPALAIGLGAGIQPDAGPLVHDRLESEPGEEAWEALDRAMAPWL